MKIVSEDEERRRRTVALVDAESILQARQRAEQELVRTKEKLEEETRILELLNRTGAALASNLDLESLAQAVTDAATELSGAEFGAFFYAVKRPEGGELTLFTLSGAMREAFERFGHPRATPTFAPAFHGDRVIRVDDVRQDPRYGNGGPHFGMPSGHLPVTSYLAVPVVARSGEVLGGLFFGHREPGVFTARSERLTVGIAAQAAIAIDNARLYEEAKRAAEDRARLLEVERSSRAEIERVSRIKDDFLATLSHELRTPLNAVLGWSEMLLSRTPRESELRGGLEKIARNSRAQAKLIEDLLDMNRIVSGTFRLDLQRVALAPILEAALEAVQSAAAAKSIALVRELDASVKPLAGDPVRLQQVVWNLLNNAVKFTPQGGRVELGLANVSGEVEISVRDTGQGFSADFAPHLFERFRQADASCSRRYGGLGLGLSIVKQLVELHGGTVFAQSAGEGQGALFVVRLKKEGVPEPVASGRQAVAGHPGRRHSRRPRVSVEGLRVLVVDDEPDARELMRAILVDAGAEVFTAASASEGLELVQAKSLAVIVSDIGMPERDGYQFMREVRSLSGSQGGQTPAIALTAFARSEDRTRAMRAGYQVHVPKPVEPFELLATIRSLVAG